MGNSIYKTRWIIIFGCKLSSAHVHESWENHRNGRVYIIR